MTEFHITEFHMPRAAKPAWTFALLAALAGGAVTALAQQGVATKRLTPKNEYTGLVEGPAVDPSGNLYVVNFGKAGTIGRIKAGTATSELFATLPVLPPAKGKPAEQSKGSGIRFDRQGRMYVAAFNTHKIFVFEPGDTTPRIYFDAAFNQPNDLAIAADGTIYASDPKRPGTTGQIWRITRDADGKVAGQIMTSAKRPTMGLTNGIDLSPDDRTLYVSESNTGQVWAYRIDGTQLKDDALLFTFHQDVDGLRVDADGTIFVARPNDGAIGVLKPDKTRLGDIKTEGKTPNNLTFGGPDGQTVFVTQVVTTANPREGYVESFRAERPGREFCRPFREAGC
jgi:sugar lactone lactonase YvrE